MQKIYPILLAGGAGTRLWPLSRKSYPKQFSKLTSEKTLFQQSASRLISSDLIEFSHLTTLTNADFRFIVGEQLQEVGIDPGSILIEPEAKNTAPAILAASIFAHLKDEEAILLVAPSDHLIPDVRNFHKSIAVGLAEVKRGKMVTFGIKPTSAETGYGYLEISRDSIDMYGTSAVSRFVEKPDPMRATQMLEAGNFLWNAGIFLFRARDMIEAFSTFAPEMLKLTSDAVNSATSDLGFLRLNPISWAELQEISIDYAIMEKAKNLLAVQYNLKWSDLGGWDSVWAETNKDSLDNAVSQNAYAIDCSNSLLRSESDSQQIVGLGLENIIAIAMPDAVLVAHKERAQDVREAVDLLKVNKKPQADTFPKDHRPWGWFESLALGDRFQVKRICVEPGAALSLQSHRHRSEHWTVVQGKAKVTLGDEVKLVNEGQSVYVPLGTVHRMENPTEFPMVLIEVQIGSYLGEDDIIRYEDVYKRL